MVAGHGRHVPHTHSLEHIRAQACTWATHPNLRVSWLDIMSGVSMAVLFLILGGVSCSLGGGGLSCASLVDDGGESSGCARHEIPLFN